MAFNYQNYTESDAVKKARQQMLANQVYVQSPAVTGAQLALTLHSLNKVDDWTGGTYGKDLQDAMDKINNREEFSYDLNGDMLYQQYKDQYVNQGKLAMMDTMGQAATLTGGYGNSFAATAGNQAYQSSLQQLNNVVPELYQLALSQYNQKGQDLKDIYAMYNDQYQAEYGRHRDDVADWNADYERLANRYYNEANMDWNRFSENREHYTDAYNNERTWDYGIYSDNYDNAFSAYQQQVAEDQFNQNLAWDKDQYAQQLAWEKEQYNQSLAWDKDQFAQTLALQQAQLNEQIRANKADEALAKAKSVSSGGTGGGGGNYSGGSSSSGSSSSSGGTSGNTTKQQKIQSEAKAFSGNIMSEADFKKNATAITRGNRGNTGNGGYKINGRIYSSYNNYVYYQIEDAYNKGKISAETCDYLLGVYGY